MLSEHLLTNIQNMIRTHKWDDIFDAFNKENLLSEKMPDDFLERCSYLLSSEIKAEHSDHEAIMMFMKLAYIAGMVKSKEAV